MVLQSGILFLLLLGCGTAQNNEEPSGLLATLINQHPTGDGPLERSFCCCSTGPCPPTNQDADNEDINDADLVGSGLINPRLGSQSASPGPEISIRIVNNPPPSKSSPLIGAQCPSSQKTCCYSSKNHVANLGSRCKPASGSPLDSGWRQSCRETVRASPSGKKCGQRSYLPTPGAKPGEASPDEFPWTCLILTETNEFVGGCAIIPETTQNDISSGTRRVITVAHKLANLKKNDLLKVRVLEYDASGFTTKETVKHQEYTVIRFIKHHRYDPKRLSDDIAVLIVDRPIDLVQYNGINAACLPSCRNMFDFRFSNGTGTRCWVAGWGKNDFDGDFQFLQHKVDVPIYDRFRCESRLQAELSKINPDLAKTFFLHPGELCAGGEKGKDACEGDGGAPLVCQSESGLWHVVGLVAWGVDCALEDVPGVYVNIYNYIDFITQRY